MKRMADTPSYTPLGPPSPKRLKRLPDLNPSPHATRSKASTPLRLSLNNNVTSTLRLIIRNNKIMSPPPLISSPTHTNLNNPTPLSLSINIPPKALGSSGPYSMLNHSLPTTTTPRMRREIWLTNTSQARPGQIRNGVRSRNVLFERPWRYAREDPAASNSILP